MQSKTIRNNQRQCKTVQSNTIHTDLDKLKPIDHTISQDDKKFRRKLKRSHKIVYVLLTFIGVTMVWYSFWTIISEIPVLNNPYICGSIGIVILAILGQFYDNLI